MSDDVQDIENAITSLIPDVKNRNLWLTVFLESLTEANTYGANKWGTYYSERDRRLRLVVGSLIVLALQKKYIWMALDQQLLSEATGFPGSLRDWRWDTGRWGNYKLIPSRNGYYLPSDDHLHVWPDIKRLHFSYIGKAASRFSQLRADSQRKHMPEVLTYLRRTLNQYVPYPNYGDPAELFSQSNPFHEIEQYQITYQDLSDTEREAIIQSRIGQGKFRTMLINYWQCCAVTGCQNETLLRASHIKPWRNSKNEERLDVYNGLLLIP
ncbi:MAG: HNH endonuclease signature motif containing protein, partial [Anaerolineae bacterium]|nr:HNH endonuclease signature motif containing protein [Anaerolineae bacterium]